MRIHTDPDPDLGPTLPSLEVNFLHEKSTLGNRSEYTPVPVPYLSTGRYGTKAFLKC